jgi:hypothetical protein
MRTSGGRILPSNLPKSIIISICDRLMLAEAITNYKLQITHYPALGLR